MICMNRIIKAAIFLFFGAAFSVYPHPQGGTIINGNGYQIISPCIVTRTQGAAVHVWYYWPAQPSETKSVQTYYVQPMTIQLGSFLYWQNAVTINRGLNAIGIPALLERVAIGGYYHWRVILYNVPPEEIVPMCRTLERFGYTDLLVRYSTPSPSLWR